MSTNIISRFLEQEEVQHIASSIMRVLRDHSYTTTPGSGFLTPLNKDGVRGGVGALIALVTVFLFFATMYIAYDVYKRGVTL